MRVDLCEVMPNARVVEANERREPGPDQTDECIVCRRPMAALEAFWIEMTTDLVLLLDEDPREDEESQGCFPVGPACLRRVQKAAR